MIKQMTQLIESLKQLNSTLETMQQSAKDYAEKVLKEINQSGTNQ